MQIVLCLETRSSSKTDYRYIKSAIDFYYVERSFKLTPVYAKSKSELMHCEKRIRAYENNYPEKTVVVFCADYDHDGDSSLNERLERYCASHSYDLVWMNKDVEEVFLNHHIPKDEKQQASFDFLKRKEKILKAIKTLDIARPLSKHPASNLLIVLDKYLRRKA